ncbi:MAG: Ppx/GppA family phosphatase [Bacteroidetes bacterium]|nr:Ppx/GppA family phosphatase [Bacteroidota bacterium]
MRVGSIDVGTNTILLLIADVDDNGTLRVVRDEQVVARVGRGVDKTGTIEWDAFTRSERFLRSYLEALSESKAEVVRATGTSALRDAKNGDDFLDYMYRNLGLEIEILRGEDEALWTYGGAISAFPDRTGRYAVLDIGGGSTELTLGKGFHILERDSIDIGCVRLTEKYLHHAPPEGEELTQLLRHIDNALTAYPDFDTVETTFVGVAGTVTTLAALELGLNDYDREKVAGFELSREMIQQRFDQFRLLSKEEIESELRVDPGRSDIIFVGIAILKQMMEIRNIPVLVVSERGLRYGIVMREWERRFEGSTIS